MSRRVLRIPLSFAVLMLWLSQPTFGQVIALQERLAKTTALNCNFSLMATGTWKDGVPSAAVTPAKLMVTFTKVDVDEGTAEAAGALGGSSLVVVRYANGYLHLMQTYSAGAIYTTTVLAKATKDGRLMAVHTRHEYADIRLPGFTSSPEMYLGDCALGG